MKEKVNEKKYELQNGVACKSSNVTLNERYDYWVETYYCKQVKLSTLTSRDEYYKRYVFPEFGKNRMQKIKQADIIVFYSTLKNQVIVSENLQIKNMVKNHHLAKTISDVSWYELTRQLEYKAEWNGRKYVKIDTFYASSQLCSACGYQNADTKDLAVRKWICPRCGAEHDRDMNAAKNILAEGLRQIA